MVTCCCRCGDELQDYGGTIELDGLTLWFCSMLCAWAESKATRLPILKAPGTPATVFDLDQDLCEQTRRIVHSKSGELPESVERKLGDIAWEICELPNDMSGVCHFSAALAGYTDPEHRIKGHRKPVYEHIQDMVRDAKGYYEETREFYANRLKAYQNLMEKKACS